MKQTNSRLQMVLLGLLMDGGQYGVRPSQKLASRQPLSSLHFSLNRRLHSVVQHGPCEWGNERSCLSARKVYQRRNCIIGERNALVVRFCFLITGSIKPVRTFYQKDNKINEHSNNVLSKQTKFQRSSHPIFNAFKIEKWRGDWKLSSFKTLKRESHTEIPTTIPARVARIFCGRHTYLTRTAHRVRSERARGLLGRRITTLREATRIPAIFLPAAVALLALFHHAVAAQRYLRFYN